MDKLNFYLGELESCETENWAASVLTKAVEDEEFSLLEFEGLYKKNSREISEVSVIRS